MLGARSGHSTPQLYRITTEGAEPEPGAPGTFSHLTGDTKLLYGPRISDERATQVAISTDRGTTWQNLDPR
jgi:hypothetical protein